ncbi:MAG: 23S rRNA (pseudouridine(1915)-N(3))-methyltransferase RlmH [Burkholderiaceae bacterium]
MPLNLLVVGTRMPAWVGTAVDEYSKRMPAELRLNWCEVKAEARTKTVSVEQCMSREASRLQAALPKRGHTVLLDERGTSATTRQLATSLSRWQNLGTPVSLIVGGADGVHNSIKQLADETLRLSDLTLPHPIVRVVLAEQLYRAWTVLTNHPYHRA